MRRGVVRKIVLVVGLLVLVSCGDDSQKPDTTPPAAVTDLALVGSTDSTLTVTWAAPGDDGDRGQAASYDLRYSLGSLPAGWDSATVVAGMPLPHQAGQVESVTVGGLEPHLLYRLALKATDEAGNVSGLSNVVEGETGDFGPPAQVTDLQAIDLAPHAATLTFTAPGDDGWFGEATAYILRRAPFAITEETWADAESVRVSIPTVPGGQPVSYRLQDLTPGTMTYYAVRARDDAAKVSPVSNTVLVDLPPDTVSPSQITDLSASSSAPFQVTLTWTAPGDDDGEGTTSSYQIRYAEEAVTDLTWDTATPVTATPTPKAPGQKQSLDVIPVPAGTTLWFAIRALDDAGNLSPLSNSPSVTVAASHQTWYVKADGTGDAPTIQDAIQRGQTGDMVLVGPGTYHEDIDFLGKGIYLKSQLGPEATILDGSEEDSSIVMCFREEPLGTVIEGFTLTGGTGTLAYPETGTRGGAVWSPSGSITLLHNCFIGNRAGFGGAICIGHPNPSLSPIPRLDVVANIFEENIADVNGGAIWTDGGNFIVRQNMFLRNRTTKGDGGACDFLLRSGTLILVDNYFLDNLAEDQGGAITVGSIPQFGAQPIEIRQNLIVRNVAHGGGGGGAGSGGGIALSTGSGIVSGNTIAANDAGTDSPYYGGGINVSDIGATYTIANNIIAGNRGDGIVCRNQASPLILSNLFWNNSRENVISLNGACRGEYPTDSIFADPLFCDPANDDYHVRSDSPALTGSVPMGAFPEAGCGP